MSFEIHPDVPDFAAVRSAVRALAPTDAARWGSMDAPRMVEHCARFNEVYLGRIEEGWAVRILARLFGGFAIRRFLATSPFEMKKGMTTLPALRMAEEDFDAGRFEASRTRFLETLAEIEAISGAWAHPLYGRIDAEVGKALARHHAAHHLHQFGRLSPGGPPAR